METSGTENCGVGRSLRELYPWMYHKTRPSGLKLLDRECLLWVPLNHVRDHQMHLVKLGVYQGERHISNIQLGAGRGSRYSLTTVWNLLGNSSH